MKLSILFENLRGSYFSVLKTPNEKVKEIKFLKKAEDIVAELLNKKSRDKNVVEYIQNNRLTGYYVYLRERGILNPISGGENLERDAYERLKKLLNTVNHLSVVAREIEVDFLVIKSLNMLPYLPVSDVDVFVEDPKTIDYFERASNVYVKSNETEENKYNFLPRDSENFFKLSFHTAVTWDNVRVDDYTISDMWEKCVQILPYVSINSPIVEAHIRIQECLLERLYLTLMDHLFLSNYLQDWRCLEVSSLPKFIELKDLKNSKGRLLLKNMSRWILWRIYYLTTGLVPFHERNSEH